MSEEKNELDLNDLTAWFSTYGLITAQRILEKYQIKLNQVELSFVVKNPESIFYKLLQVPVRNVLNGIVLQQAKDYQVYMQKLFIDYLLSGESGKPENSSGNSTRKELEENRQELLNFSEAFQKQEKNHLDIIASSQLQFIDFTKKWLQDLQQHAEKLMQKFPGITPAQSKSLLISSLVYLPKEGHDFSKQVNHVLKTEVKNMPELIDYLKKISLQLDVIPVDIDELLYQTKQMSVELQATRTKFYDSILRVTELLTQLSDYQLVTKQLAENKENLFFDREIGVQE